MIVAYTLVLALILFTIRARDYPFDGLVQVGPEAFEAALSRTEPRTGRWGTCTIWVLFRTEGD